MVENRYEMQNTGTPRLPVGPPVCRHVTLSSNAPPKRNTDGMERVRHNVTSYKG